MNDVSCCERPRTRAWSVDRQVRLLSGFLVLIGISLSFLHPVFLFLAVIVALGMVLSAIAGTCAMGVIVSWLPWNR